MKKLITLLLFLPLMLNAQRYDTTKVILLVSDTTKPFSVSTYCDYYYYSGDTIKFEGYRVDTSYFNYNYSVRWVFAYSVKELHNTSEGFIDPGFNICVDRYGNKVPCFHDYWKHIKYIDEEGKDIKLIIWNAIELK